ncbi:hypothetical protein McpSp1_16960 [Methanocorpusculaceae archaeon Sp1]|nr:hypothetical protein [Methanocorpusculaceae archaeon Sp1]
MQIETPHQTTSSKHSPGFLWITGLLLLLLLLIPATTTVAAASVPNDNISCSQHTEIAESTLFHTGYQIDYTYQQDGEWHPDNIIVWTPKIQQENPQKKYVQAPYNSGSNAENYRKIAEWTQKVRDADASASATLSNNQDLLHKAIFPGIFIDGPVSSLLKIFGIIEKTKAERNVYNEYTQQYIDNIYGSAMMMEDLQTG